MKPHAKMEDVKEGNFSPVLSKSIKDIFDPTILKTKQEEPDKTNKYKTKVIYEDTSKYIGIMKNGKKEGRGEFPRDVLLPLVVVP